MLPQSKTPRRLDPRKLTMCLYGRPKIGKSSLAAQFGDRTLFLALEPGLSGLEVYQLAVHDWATFAEAIRELAQGGHSFDTVIIDVIDELRPLVLRHIEEHEGLSTTRQAQSARAFGRANAMIAQALKLLQLSGVGIVFVSHERIHQVDAKGQIVGAFDKAAGAVREKVFPSVSGRVRDLVLGMSDCILRYAIDERTGRRMFQTKPTPDVEAGERFGILPPVIDAGASAEEAHAALLAPFREAWKKSTSEPSPSSDA